MEKGRIKMLNAPNETITIETRIKDESAYPILSEWNIIFNTLKRKLYVDLYHRNRLLSEVKVEYLALYQISARHFNSIVYNLKSQVSSFQERIQFLKKTKEQKIKSLEKLIKNGNQDLEQLKQDRKKIEKYILQVKRYKTKKDIQKPIITQKLKDTKLEAIALKIESLKFQLHHKTRKRDRCLLQLAQLYKEEKLPPRICFGTKIKFKKQFNLEENDLQDHAAWKNLWEDARNNSSYWIGSCDETRRNQNAQYDHVNGILKLRLPDCLGSNSPHLNLHVDFNYKKDDLIHALTKLYSRYNYQTGKLEQKAIPVSYRILKRDGIFYLQAIFERPSKEITTLKDTGAIGIDFNMNHLAVTEMDRFGNPIWASSHYFDFDQKNSEKNMAQLSDYLSMIVARAVAKRKSLAIEKLDFSSKRSQLKENFGPKFNLAFTSMAYKKYEDLVTSKCQRSGVVLKKVSPAYTSLIGAFKFGGYTKYTSHELAALSIARRSLRMSERLKSKVTFKEPVRILDLEKVSSTKIKHVWSYWSRMSYIIRGVTKSRTQQRIESSNPYYPIWVLSDLGQYRSNLARGCEKYFRRNQLKYNQWVRGKYCCFPVVKGHTLIKKSYQRFG
jgi:IS605 OrfB family transposase